MKREILGCLTEDDWKLLLDNARQMSYRKGEMILAEGSQERAIFLLERGYASIESSSQGHGIHLNQIGPGEIFGEVSFLEGQGASASAIAEEDAEVKIIDGPQLQSLLSSVPGLATRFYQSLALTLAQRLRRLSDRFVTSQSQSATPGVGYQVPRIGNMSERQVPDSLMNALERFRSELLQVERQLQGRQLSSAEGRDRVRQTCDFLVEQFVEQVEAEALIDRGWDDLLAFNDTDQLEAGIGDYVFREAFPWLMRSAAIACCHSRGRSYANDYLIGEIVNNNEPAGDGWLGDHIDAWFLSRPFCQSYRQGRQLLIETIVAATEAKSSMIRIASLASGNAQELFSLLETHSSRFYATCLDSSSEALAFNARRSRESNFSDRMNVLQGNILALIAGEDSLALPPQDIIYALDLCDRWEDDRVVLLLDWAYDCLAEDGKAVFANLKPDFPDRLLFKHLLNWPQFYRTEAEWRSLLARSCFGAAAIAFQTDATGWMGFAIASK